jgi:uncharacterized membrane protein YkvA (DUF1232 family)
MLERLKSWAKAIKRDVVALYLAGRDPRVPWYAKVMALVTAAYALSPIDLIPDFIPVLGYLDDLLIVPAAIVLTVRFIPRPVMAALREEASRRLAQKLPGSRAGAVAIVAIWLVVAALLVRWLIAG